MINTQGVQHYPIDPATGLLPYGNRIIVPNGGGYMAADWPDSNLDGLADGWGKTTNGTPSIVTGNGFSGNAQRLVFVTGALGSNGINIQDLLQQGVRYRISLKYRCSDFIYIDSGVQRFATVTANTGNAALFQVDVKKTSTGNALEFYARDVGHWFEIDEVNIEELPCELSLPLANSLTDFSPNSHVVTAPNGYSSASDKFEQAGQAISLNGTSQYLLAPVIAIPTTQVSVNVWIYPTDPTVRNQFVVSQYSGAMGGIYEGFYLNFQGSNFQIAAYTGTTLGFANVTVPLNEWSMITAVYNTANGMKGYLNGQYVSSYSGTLNSLYNNTNTYIGDSEYQAYYFKGRMSKVLIENRELTHAEIDRLWRQQP